MEDILLEDATNDLLIKSGDFALGDAAKQHQKHLLLADKGVYKQHPTIGVGMQSFIDDEDTAGLQRETRREFVRDGMKINDLKILEGGTVGVDANY